MIILKPYRPNYFLLKWKYTLYIFLPAFSFFMQTITNRLYAQDAVFSQYYASSLYLNPALAGLQPDIALSTNYRMQWLNVNPYTTTQISLIYPFLNKNNPIHEHIGGAGLSVFKDNAGEGNAMRTSGANLNLAYNISLGIEKINLISFGLQGGFVQQQLNTSNYIWGSQYTTGSNMLDVNNGENIMTQKFYPSIASGVMWYFANSKDVAKNSFKAYAGGSLYNINRPNKSMLEGQIIRAPWLIKFNGGMSLPLSKRISLSPNAIVALQNGLRQINVGMYLSFLLSNNEVGIFAHPEFIVGGWYRLGDAVIFNTGFATNRWSVGFSYDLNNSSLSKYTNSQGAYEISLGIKIPRGLKIKRYDTPRI